MNRAVEYYFKNMTCKSFGYHVIRAYEYAPNAYKRNKEFHNANEKMPNPVELVKYSIKIFDWLPSDDEKVSLKALQQINDPLEIIEFGRFTNQFIYIDSEEAFVPNGKMVQGTPKMKAIWDKVEPRRVQKAWDKAKPFLRNANDEEPVLSYNPK
jgi:hypothetical protein